MILVGVMAAVLWGVGALMGAPRRARLVMLAVLFAGVMVVQLALPDGHPLREATGGEAALWLLLAAFAALALLYGRGLRWLRKKATPAEADRAPMEDPELQRSLRHITLREIGGPGQARLKAAKVLVVGAGGLGSPVLQYLAAAGVGTIGVIDDDVVEATNLQRQVIHADAAIDLPKVRSAAEAMRAQNPFVTVRPYERRLTEEIAAGLIAEYDLVLDGSDSFDTRALVNASCVAAGVPLIGGALTAWEGQLSLYDPARGGPCYACVFPEAPAPGLVPTCAEAGVLGPLPGVIGSMMAVEAVKRIAGAGEGLSGRLMLYDALNAEARVIEVARRADCPVCGEVASA